MAAITSAVIGGLGLASSIAGQRSADKASRRATDAQVASGQAAIASQEAGQLRAEQLAQPFTQFGVSQLDPLQSALAPVTQEQEFAQLQSNPLFQAAIDQGRQGIAGQLSLGGRIGSGDESAALSRNLLLSAAPLLGQQRQQRQQNIQNLFTGTGIGQASAVGQAANVLGTAANVGNLQTQIGNVQGAGIVAGQQAGQQGREDLLSQLPGLATSIGGLFSPPPDPFGTRQAGFNFQGDPFAPGNQ